MMKKLVALLMALALLCSSIGAFATEETEPVAPVEEVGQVEEVAEAPAEESAEESEEETHEHVYDVLVKDDSRNVPATALVGGKQVYACKCGEADKVVDVDPLFDVTKADKTLYDLSGYVQMEIGEGNEKGTHTDGYARLSNPKDFDKENTCKVATYIYFCIECKKEITVKVEGKKAHVAIGSPVRIQTGDCTTPDIYQYTGCKVCGEKTVWTETGEVAGHKSNPADRVNHPATCQKAGYVSYTCTVCGEPIEEPNGEAKKDHTPSKEPKDAMIVPATCVSDGVYSKAIVCDVCGEVLNDSQDGDNVRTIKALGANHQALLNQMAKDGAFYTENETTGVVKIAVDQNGKAIFKAGETIEKDATEAYEEYNKDMTPVTGSIKVGKFGKLKIVYTPATCEGKGHISVTCTTDGCGASIEKDLTPLGHEISEGIDHWGPWDDEADCTKGMSQLVQCVRYKDCGYTFNIEIPARKEHSYGDEPNAYAQKAANGNLVEYDTIEDIGKCSDYYEIYYCQNPYCDHEEYVLVKGTGKHVVNDEAAFKPVENPATCLEDGIRYYECKNCRLPQVEEIPATGHKLVGLNVLEPATCTTSGKRAVYCTNPNCGQKKYDEKAGKYVVVRSVGEKEGVDWEVIPAIGHNMVPVVIKADCINNIKGVSYKKCSICDIETEHIVTDGHVPTNVKITTPNSCTTNGKYDFTCKICHVTFRDQVLPKTGHTYEQGNNGEILTEEEIKKNHSCNDGDAHCVAPTCVADKKHVLKCSVKGCGAELTWTEKDTNLKGHTPFLPDGALTDKFQVMRMPTCESEGYAMYNCTREGCGAVEKYVLPKLPHNLRPDYDDETGTFSFVCDPIYNESYFDEDMGEEIEYGKEHLHDLIFNAYENQTIAQLVYDKAIADTAYGAKFGTFGDKSHVIEVPVMKSEYAITSENGVGKIALKDKNMQKLDTAYARITWRYQLANGDTVGFKACLPINIADNKLTGTFKLTGLTAPRGSKLIDRYVEVVTDADADLKPMDTYTTYGAGPV